MHAQCPLEAGCKGLNAPLVADMEMFTVLVLLHGGYCLKINAE